jgi:tetratricopeptide (TPR) repeat protein
MKGPRFGLIVLFGICLVTAFSLISAQTPGAEGQLSSQSQGYAGTSSCRECHEKFYKLWAPSHHGRAMQPYSDELAREALTPQTEDTVIGPYRYRAEIEPGEGWVVENGPDGENRYRMEHALGGKNVYFFLTPLERGRLQTLPVAYDVRRKKWFDMAASGVRHFPGGTIEDEPVDWKEWPYTFNTGCYRCHVSQLTSNYDLETDTYQTTWAEPGINCETCHGPGDEHIRVCKQAPEGQIPGELKMIRGGRDFTVKQNNEACAPCHAKMEPISTSFSPGDRYFDHYTLTTLEHPDFYPDGRDLGENYTYTLWLLSPCTKSEQLSCFHCHTSSGRYKQKEDPNKSCLPCHQKRVENATKHSHHPAESDGNKCISCHMPMTEFARMRRSDHSMLPPTPAATIAFQSPNACNLCHRDRDAAWADSHVRKWHERDYQAPILHRAGLVDSARKQDWTRLPEMLEYLTRGDRDEVYAASLIHLLRTCRDSRKWPVILKAMEDPSPLVRSAAAAALGLMPSIETGEALVKATGDDYRLVRIRAAGGLGGAPIQLMEEENRERVEKAIEEHLASLTSRPDFWASHYNLGNYYLDRGDLRLGLAAYERASKLEPHAVMPLVNASIAHARLGENEKAEDFLKEALQLDPDNGAANFNMGLLKSEQNDRALAETHLRRALQSDPNMAEAAYNLGVLLTKDQIRDAMQWLLKAYELNPNPVYGYTIAFYMNEYGDPERAADMLRMVNQFWPMFVDAYLLLGEIYKGQGKQEEARGVYQQGLNTEGLLQQDRYRLEASLRALESETPK